MSNYLDYKSGSLLVLNHHIETEVINTKGKAYGAELLIKKTSGRINGWLSYTKELLECVEVDADNLGALYEYPGILH